MSERLTAMDVEKQEFRRKLRGFDPDDVRMYLESVAEELERVNRENGELREEIGTLKARLEEHKSTEQELRQTLISAQAMVNEIKERSRAEADLVLREARLKAERVLHSHQEELTRLESEISRRKVERDLFTKRLRCILEEHLALLEQRRPGSPEFEALPLLASRNRDAG